MAGAPVLSAYVDVGEYLRAATNMETASLLGLATTLTAATQVGATALPVVASVGWVAGPVWLLDGPTSEVAQVVAAPDGATLTLAAPGAQYAHAAGVSVSQAGAAGALAEAILRASAWVESYCQQGAPGDRSLFALPRVERLALPGARAWREPDGALTLRPSRFPVGAVTALAVETAPGASVALDASQVEAPSSARLVELHACAMAGSSGWAAGSGGGRGWVTLSYSGGLTPGAVPYEVRQACLWVVSDLLAQRRNPTGAAVVRMGRFETQARLRGDAGGDSVLLMRAKEALQPWRSVW